MSIMKKLKKLKKLLKRAEKYDGCVFWLEFRTNDLKETLIEVAKRTPQEIKSLLNNLYE